MYANVSHLPHQDPLHNFHIPVVPGTSNQAVLVPYLILVPGTTGTVDHLAWYVVPGTTRWYWSTRIFVVL